VSWPHCWHVCANLLKKSFRSLSPLPASKFWANERTQVQLPSVAAHGVSAV
jgi:hypothetical protein